MSYHTHVSSDRRAGDVVLRMTPEIARIYAEELDHLARHRHDGTPRSESDVDQGFLEDAEQLRAAADRLDHPADQPATS